MSKSNIIGQAQAAKEASRMMMGLSSEKKNEILEAIAKALEENMDDIIFKNEIDVQAAKDAGLNEALIDRLTLTKERVKNIAKSVREIIALKDPVGEILETINRPNGLVIKKLRVPLGVIGIIYESRPNVTVDTTVLCIKSGNAVILRGGSEALNSNHALAQIISKAGYEAGLPNGAIQFIDTTDREAIKELLELNKYIDVIIPRGSHSMIDTIVSYSKIPVIQHGEGICHTYIDKQADIDMAVSIAFNAKAQRPGVCNAMESLLVHKDIAEKFLPLISKKLREAGVTLKACEKAYKILMNQGIASEHAVPEDWDTEYLSLVLAIRVVDSMGDAIKHVQEHGSGHSEAIVTKDKNRAHIFLMNIDAAAVYWNASTRFTDGGEFGLGAEIGISTQKLHARGPMGIKELTSYKYIIFGNGQIRE
ncbi:MAG: glutamate-5-semialdehyde dehydrogenase [Elusimicrobiota bacterium]